MSTTCVADGSIDHYGDMWATLEESSEYIVGYYRRACAHADETIGALELDAVGSIPWHRDESTAQAFTRGRTMSGGGRTSPNSKPRHALPRFGEAVGSGAGRS